MYFISMLLLIPRILILVIIAFSCACRNPFFPPTGAPSETGGRRDTPANVIRQLISSYQLRNIYLFNDLISPNYRFYVSTAFTEYQGTPGAVYEDIADTAFTYVEQGGRYYYWTGDAEKKVHQNMFESASTIKFNTRPYSNENSYVYTVKVTTDSLGHTTFDTTNVEIEMLNGEIEITLEAKQSYFINIQKQMFYLERDPVDRSLWVIAKWFDLGI
jgi:hypothetical protein